MYLLNGCKPFDDMPFINSLKGHNPKLVDLFLCIPSNNRKHELLARLVKNNTEMNGQLFTSIKEIVGFNDIPKLVEKFNDSLWQGHFNESKLIIDKGQIFINGYKEDTCFIMQKLIDLSREGIKNYSNSIALWLNDSTNGVDCNEKRKILLHMFDYSRVSLIYGSAGTGKSTLINHIAQFFSDKSKIFLAQTNPAVDNLKHRVIAGNSKFMTIYKFIKCSSISKDYDILFIDECSTVSNHDMRNLLTKAKYKLLVLVGDTYQISSIRFGNWFSIAKSFLPSRSISELTIPYRGKDNKGLQTLWGRVRNIGNVKENGDAILESEMKQNYSVNLDTSIFTQTLSNEIILCLNYDGLYGINNINRFLQENNPSPAVQWGVHKFKINDPILFADSEQLAPAIYNNMKGIIVGIEILEPNTSKERIQFDIELDKSLNEADLWGTNIELLENSCNGNSIIRFNVKRNNIIDDDLNDVIPFQIAYAISIHKSQGLEYDSVKIVITDEVDELITHNIFYTAITRTMEKLKIYWSPEVEKRVLSTIKPMNSNKDVSLLRQYL